VTGTEVARVQIIGMSATVSNIDALAHWLNAKVYVTDYRCVRAHTHIPPCVQTSATDRFDQCKRRDLQCAKCVHS
jgi:replicative superfamily II helicase